MKDMNGIKIIAVDHGYGNIKTANCCFKSGLVTYDAKPPIGENLLICEGKYYLIGAKHKNYDGSKVVDDDYTIPQDFTVYADLTMLRYPKRPADAAQTNHSSPLGWSLRE